MLLKMEVIWYNPDRDEYEKGSPGDFESIASASVNQMRFSILYQFNESSKKLAQKVLDSLNLVREDSRLRM